jgi:hypothetical protein
MKTASAVLLMICLLFANTAHPADDWTQVFPDLNPSARYWHAMAYLGEDQVLLFGGTDGFDETWIYDLGESTWTQLYPSSHPQSLFWHSMVHIGTDQVLLFGGANGGYHDETWIYDLGESTWTQQHPATKPSARWIHDGMAYIDENQALVFGGQDGGGYCGNTWVYDLSANTWILFTPATEPSARWGHAMAYIGEDRVLLFGGYDSGGRDNETWIYDLSEGTWTQQNPSTKPSARYEHAMAYLGGDQVFLFGGQTTSGYDEETWIYDLSDDDWILDTNTTQPSARSRYGLSETSIDGSSPLVLFGGCQVTAVGETWLFGGGDYITPPAAIADLTAALAGSTIRLSWTGIGEDIGGNPSIVEYYTIYRNADPIFSPGPGDSIGGTAETFYDDLTPALKDTLVNHYYIVKAVDSEGRKSADSNKVGEFDRDVITSP